MIHVLLQVMLVIDASLGDGIAVSYAAEISGYSPLVLSCYFDERLAVMDD